MKKVLSVLLAAAMVAGMSVSSFATDWTWTGPTADTGLNASDITLQDKFYVTTGDVVIDESTVAADALNPGDALYFPMLETVVKANAGEIICGKEAHDHANCTVLHSKCLIDHKHDFDKDNWCVMTPDSWDCTKEVHTHVAACKADITSVVNYTGKIDKDWTLKSKTDKYVASVAFACFNTTTSKFSTLKTDMSKDYPKYVKVTLVADLDSTSEVEVDFEAWIKDKTTVSNSVIFDGVLMANEGTTSVYDEDYITVSSRRTYKAAEKAEVIFDFNDEAYFGVKMIKGETVVLNLSQTYDAAIDKAYNEYDADLTFYNFKGSKDAFTKTGELFIPAAEESYIYEIVDGALVEIEATYVTDHDIYGMDVEDGWVIETKELGYYVVADEELVVPEVETEVEVETPAEPEKANPETGAADFVGAAVAMAVVSVAAAGALALKK